MRAIVRLLRNSYPWMLVALFSVLAQPRGDAEVTSATLHVTIADSSGAVIPNADVRIRNAATNQEQRRSSGQLGAVSFPLLKPGDYSLFVKKDGFAEIAVDNIVLNVGDEKGVKVILKVGSSSENITVDGNGLTLNTTDGSVSTVIDRKFVENLPLNGRSFQDLILLTPGISTATPQTSAGGVGYTGDFSVNGQRTESNSYTVDGVSQNTAVGGSDTGNASPGTSGSLGASTVLGTTQSLISVDALQEFRVESSTYSAEYGRSPGGQFSLASRSGTNALHGTLFEYLRNNVFDANDWFNDHYQIAQAPLRQNDFGGTVGGPVLVPRLYDGRKRTFFFVSYEGLRLVQPQAAALQYVPSLSLRRNAPAPLAPLLNAFSVPTGPEIFLPDGTSSGLAPFVAGYSLPSTINSTSLRLDQSINSKVTFFGRAAYTPSQTTARFISEVFPTTSNLQSYTAGLDMQVTPRLTQDARLGYVRGSAKASIELDNFAGAIPVNMSQSFGAPTSLNGVGPEIYLSLPGGSPTYIQTSRAANYERQWNVTDTIGWNIGRHLLKIGVDYRKITSPFVPQAYQPFVEYLSVTSVMTNTADSVSLGRYLGAAPIYNQWAFFGQDNWRLTPRLSLSMGLRWEIEPPPTSGNSNKPYPLAGNLANPSTLTLGQPGQPLYNTRWNNIAPRFGIAWIAHALPGRETVLRGGIGNFYDTGQAFTEQVFQGLGSNTFTTPITTSLPFPSTLYNITPSVTVPYGLGKYFDPNFQLPFTLQWNASLEQALGKNQSLTVSYVGANGRELVQERILSIKKLNPNFTTLITYGNGSPSLYHSLQTSFQRHLSKGLQVLASYTWAHSIDYESSNGDLAYTRGNAGYDLRNNAQAAVSWDLPDHIADDKLNYVLGHWSIDARVMARSAFPVTLTGNNYFDTGTGQLMTTELNLVSGQPIYSYGTAFPGGRSVNPAAFALAPAHTNGNAPRNFIRGFGAAQANLAVRRDFPIHESLHLQFRAEAFNITNHPQFGYIDPMLGDPTFGQALKSLNSSLPTLSSLYQQGGARSLQFALKVSF
jgi:hypothetical protein